MLYILFRLFSQIKYLVEYICDEHGTNINIHIWCQNIILCCMYKYYIIYMVGTYKYTRICIT